MRIAIVGLVSAALALVGTSAPAFADGPTATTASELTTDLGMDNVTVQVGSVINSPNLVVSTGSDVTLDLDGNDVSLGSITIDPDSTFTVEDTSPGAPGILTADASIFSTSAGNEISGSDGVAGIDNSGSGGSAAAFKLESGTVVATGSPRWGAGVGGALGPDRDGEMAGSVVVDGGELDATGGTNAAAIGAGFEGDYGPVTINAGVVNAEPTENGLAAIGNDNVATQGDPGAITISGGHVTAAHLGGYGPNGGASISIGAGADVTLDGRAVGPPPSFTTSNDDYAPAVIDIAGALHLGHNGSFTTTRTQTTIESSGILDGYGYVDGSGPVVNHGTIGVSQVSVASVSDHNYDVSFGSGDPDSPSVPDKHIYGTSFAAAEQALPTPEVAGEYISSWNTASDGSGTTFTTSTPLSGDITIYAQWAALSQLAVTSTPSGAVTAGNGFIFDVLGEDAAGNVLADQTSVATITSTPHETGRTQGDDAADIEVYFDTVGTYQIVATAGGLTSGAYDVVVTPGGLSGGLTIDTPTAGTVPAGVPQVFSVSGLDGLGNPTGDLTANATFTGLDASDVIHGSTITFGKRGARAITATVPDVDGDPLTAVVHLTIEPASLTQLKFTSPVASATAGKPVKFHVSGTDSLGKSIGDVTSATTFTVSPAGAVVSAGTVTFTSAGEQTVTAADGSVTTTTTVNVGPGTLANVTLPQDPTSTAGDPVILTPAGTDAYGDVVSIAASSIKVTSSVSSDKASHNSITMKSAGTRTLTITASGVSEKVTWTVIAAAPVGTRLGFVTPDKTGSLNVPFSVAVGVEDAFGNVDGSQAADSYTVTGTGGSVHDAVALFAAAGTYTITATLGSLQATEKVTIGKEAAAITVPTTALTASVDDNVLTVSVQAGASGIQPTGSVTLTEGKLKLTQPLETGAPSTAAFPIPALKVGTYSFSAAFAGDDQYAAKTTKVSVKVVPGAVAVLKFVKPPKSTVAGKALILNVVGYDANGNSIGSENAKANFALDTTGFEESARGNDVTLTQVGARTVTASIGSVTVQTTIAVSAAGASVLTVTPSDSTPVAGDPVTFTATATDAYENPLGDVTSKLKGSSTVSSDHFAKNVGTFTKSGNRTLTLADGAASESLAVTVLPGELVAGKLVFDSSSTTAYSEVPFSVQVSSSDKYGNPIEDCSADDAAYSVVNASSYPHDVFPSEGEIGFNGPGTRTVSATCGGITITKKVKVVADTMTAHFPSSITTNNPSYEVVLDITLTANHSDVSPNGTATVYVGSQVYPDVPREIADDGSTHLLVTLNGYDYGAYTAYLKDTETGLIVATKTPKVTFRIVPPAVPAPH